MTYMVVNAGELTAEYFPDIDESAYTACVRVRFTRTDDAEVAVFLGIEDVRYLADELPRLLMAHDAAEHAAKEQAKAKAEAA